jgi:hypothetical protein
MFGVTIHVNVIQVILYCAWTLHTFLGELELTHL